MSDKSIIEKIRGGDSTENPHPISGPALLKMIGVLALLLPIVLILGAAILDDCQLVQNSISAYYHTIMGNFFVGTLCAVAISMFAYFGYNANDNKFANLAGVFALGVAFFPSSVDAPFTDCLASSIETGVCSTFHFISATGLFMLLAVFSLIIFTQKKGQMTGRKKMRNRVYVCCGWLIVLCIILIALYLFLFQGKYPKLDYFRPVFYLEALALGAFSLSWLTKGGWCMPDKQ